MRELGCKTHATRFKGLFRWLVERASRDNLGSSCHGRGRRLGLVDLFFGPLAHGCCAGFPRRPAGDSPSPVLNWACSLAPWKVSCPPPLHFAVNQVQSAVISTTPSGGWCVGWTWRRVQEGGRACEGEREGQAFPHLSLSLIKPEPSRPGH